MPSSAEQDELTELLKRQLEVVRRIRVRCELVSRRRAHLLNQLRGLWTHAALLRDEVHDADDRPAAASERLVALLGEMESARGES
jgi:hypothetical protein